MRIILFLNLLCFLKWGLIAQTDSTSNEGKIKAGEIIIQKDREIVLPKGDKLFQRAELKDLSSESIKVKLSSQEPDLIWPTINVDLPFKRTIREYPVSVHQNYLKLGYGNFNSPLVEVGFNKRLNALEVFGNFFHESFQKGPVNGSTSANSHTKFESGLIYPTELLTIKPFIRYDIRGYRFYGNTDLLRNDFEENAPKVRWSSFHLGWSLEGVYENISYKMTPGFMRANKRLMNGDDIGIENVFSLVGDFEYEMNKRFKTGLETQAIASAYKSGINLNRSFFYLTPWINYVNDELVIKAGFTVASTDNGNSGYTGVYPLLNAALNISDTWSLYGIIAGGIQWNGLNELLTQNEFLDDSLNILNEETTYDFGGGIKGHLIKNLTVDLSVRYASINNLPFFVPSSSDSSRYIITYDHETVDRITIKGVAKYLPNSKSLYGVEMKVNGYSTSTLERPWHLPAFEFQLYTSHNIQEKLLLSTNILALGGIRAPTTVGFGIKDLDTIIDVGFGVKYLINQRFSTFMDIQNLFNKEYERYLGYPVRGVNFKLGGQYRF